MDRAQLMQQIAQLDKQINDLSAKNRVPSLNAKHRSFPVGAWTTTIFFFALGMFGPQFLDALTPYATYCYIAGALFGIFAIYRTLMFLLKGNVKTDKKYAAAMTEVAVLQKQREALQKQLAAMK